MYDSTSTKEYVPHLYADTLEMNQICIADDYVLNLSLEATNQVLANNFIKTADSERLAAFEKFLQLSPPEDTPLEERRFQVMTLWNLPVPYTIGFLQSKLDSIQGSPVRVILNPDTYTLTVAIRFEKSEQFEQIKSLLASVVPANIVLDIIISEMNAEIESPICFGTAASFTEIIAIAD